MKPAALVFSVVCLTALGTAAWALDAPPSPAAPSVKPAQRAPAAPILIAQNNSAPAAGAKKEPQKVTLRLDWFVVGNNAMYYIAKDKGFYADEGIDVDIGPGKGSISTSQVVGSGRDMFGIADTGTAAVAISRGIPITVIASFVQTSPMCVTVLASSGIEKPTDLKGKRFGEAPSGASESILPAYLKAIGLSRSDISVVGVEPSAKWSVVSEGRVDAIADFITSAAPIVELKAGKKVRTFLYADAGVNVLGTGMIVNNEVMKQHPDLVRRFLRASIKGWEYAEKHPEETVEAGLKRSHAGDRKVFMRQLTDSFKLLHTKSSQGKPLGWMSEKDWDESLKLLREYLKVPGGKPASAFYTNAFVQ